MTDGTAARNGAVRLQSAGGVPVRISRPGLTSAESWAAPDARRHLQLALAAIWLLDAVLQFQAVMFSRSFPQLLADTAHGNPALIADPVTWSARLIEHHVAAANASFASIQLLLALGIACRPATRIALAASVAWALAVWWLGEGLGLLLTGTASPVNGAPGAVIIYALLAILLWPARGDRGAGFVAGRAIGARAARLAWLGLWGGLGCLAVQQAVRAPQAMGSAISGMAAGEPGWLARTDGYLGRLLSQHGLAACVVLAAALLLVGACVYLPARAARAGLVLAIAIAAAIGIAEAFGGILAGSGTDPNSAPLLALLAVAYWPAAAPRTRTSAASPQLAARLLTAGPHARARPSPGQPAGAPHARPSPGQPADAPHARPSPAARAIAGGD
jgi:hypothetical protein